MNSKCKYNKFNNKIFWELEKGLAIKIVKIRSILIRSYDWLSDWIKFASINHNYKNLINNYDKANS